MLFIPHLIHLFALQSFRLLFLGQFIFYYRDDYTIVYNNQGGWTFVVFALTADRTVVFVLLITYCFSCKVHSN
jgi:hypothetical protein